MLFRSTIAMAIVAACPAALAQVAPKAPEPATLRANAEMAKNLPFADRQDFDDAMDNARRSGA
jgi:linear primary-alkylsulfatase